MKVGIVGSRNFSDYPKFKQLVVQWLKKNGIKPENLIVVSGGAKGVDKLAERFALEETKNKPIIFLPQYSLFSAKEQRKAPLARNQQIVNESERIIAFPTKDSTGTYHTINLAKKKKIPIDVFNV